MDEELDRFKKLDLAQFAASRGYQLVQREQAKGGGWRGSTSTSILMRNPLTDDKLVIRRDADGHWIYFSVLDGADNGTIIDFLQRRDGRALGAIRQELRSWSGQYPLATSLPQYEPPGEIQRRNRAAVLEAFRRARFVDNHTYLNSRGIRPETLQSDRFKGTWLEDEHGNVIFPHRDGPALTAVCGWEKKNRGFTGFASGGVKTIWISRARRGDNKLVFVEGAIDALSYHQIHADPNTRYASTGGAIGERRGADFITRAIARMPPGSTIITATDRDAEGDKYALQIAALAATVPVPVIRDASTVGKDWNDFLKDRERDYIKTLEHRRGAQLGR